MRGVSDSNGKSPFWEAVGRKFFNIDFATADNLCVTRDKQFIADLASRMPIYIDLLPAEAQEVIGKEHPDATPAKKLLTAQGFRFSEHVDIFDAGPVLTAWVENIPVVYNSKVVVIQVLEITDDTGVKALLYNMRLNARITADKIQIIDAATISISPLTADTLQVQSGDQLRYYLF